MTTQRDHVVAVKSAWQHTLTAIHHLEPVLITGPEAAYLQQLVRADCAATPDGTKQAKEDLAEKLRRISE